MRTIPGHILILFIVLFWQFTFVCCTSSEEDNNMATSFFEDYDGTKWAFSLGANHFDYLKFNNDPKKYLEYWYVYMDDYCFGNNYVNNDMKNGGIFKIIENSKYELIIKMDEKTTTRFTVEEDVLKVVERYNNGIFEDQVRYYNRAYEPIENMKHCSEKNIIRNIQSPDQTNTLVYPW